MNRTTIDVLQLPLVMRASLKSLVLVVLPICLFLTFFCVGVMPTLLGRDFQNYHIVLVYILALPILLPQIMLLSWWYTVRITIDQDGIACGNCFTTERIYRFDDIERVRLSSGRGTKYLKLIPKDPHVNKFTIPLHVLSEYNRKVLSDLFKDKIDLV